MNSNLYKIALTAKQINPNIVWAYFFMKGIIKKPILILKFGAFLVLLYLFIRLVPEKNNDVDEIEKSLKLSSKGE